MARLIDADALKKQWSMADKCEDCPQDARRCQFEQDFTRMDICEMIDEAPTVGGWISVKDRLPEKSEYVISYGQGEFYVCKYSVRHKAFNADDYDGGDFYKLDSITHWMPLPEPPEEVTGDG